jgi:hypothetical protein
MGKACNRKSLKMRQRSGQQKLKARLKRKADAVREERKKR